MHYDTIKLELQDDIAVITLNRPHVMNALNTQMRAEITQAVTQSGKDARVVVLTGEGKAFCSGQDLGDRQSVANLDLNEHCAMNMNQCCMRSSIVLSQRSPR